MKKIYVIMLMLFVISYINAQHEEYLFSPKGIAEIRINLEDGKNINDIKNEKAYADYVGKLKAVMTISNSSSSTYESTDLYTGNILIDGRGNTSWHRSKRPYNIDLVEADWDTERFAALLGMPEGEEWALISFWNDRSLMRFQIASYLGQYMEGIKWMPRNRYVEVWINNDYRGLYALTEKILRDKNRVDVKKLDAVSTNLTGGYILEATSDEKLKPSEIAVQFRSAKYDINFTFKYPKVKNVTLEQRIWIKNYLDEFETVLQSNGYKDETNGYKKYIEVDNFIDWTILHELSKGCDNLFHASIFLHKDRDGKLNMSAPWDFDLSFGNSGIYTEEGSWVRMHRWFGRLYQDENYAQQFNARFDELLPLMNTIPDVLMTNYEQLKNAGVLAREYAKFPVIIDEFISDGEGRMTPYSYKGHVQFLSEWIMSRKNWIFIDLGLDNNEKGSRMREIKPVIRIMAPEDMEAKRSFDVKVMRSKDNETNKYTYSWNDGAFGSTWTRNISQIGKYWVKMKDEWGNVSQVSDTLYFGVNKPTSVQGLKTEMLFTYSNPSTDFITINYSSPSKKSNLLVNIIDLRGKNIISENFDVNIGYNQLQVSTSDVPKGVYIMRLQADKNTVSRKIIIN